MRPTQAGDRYGELRDGKRRNDTVDRDDRRPAASERVERNAIQLGAVSASGFVFEVLARFGKVQQLTTYKATVVAPRCKYPSAVNRALPRNDLGREIKIRSLVGCAYLSEHQPRAVVVEATENVSSGPNRLERLGAAERLTDGNNMR
jgi:hypothetical protein